MLQIRDETIHEAQFLWAYTNGTLLSSRMFTITIPCKLDVLLYPFDTVDCQISIGSFTYVYDGLFTPYPSTPTPTLSRPIELPAHQLTA